MKEARVVTAKDGVVLREYARQHQGNRIAVFPECGLSVNEQAAYLKNYLYDYDEIITFSPFIVSDSKNLKVLDGDGDLIKFGDSVNRINITFWRRDTIGDRAVDSINSFREQENPDIQEICRELGDSVEKTLLINGIINREEKKKKKS